MALDTESIDTQVDVVVVGLGPVGAVIAGLLGRRGLSVAAFDRLPDVYPQPRAIVLDHEAMRIIQELGIASRVLPHTAPYRPSEYRGLGGRVIRKYDSLPPPYLLGWEPNRTFDQPSVEREFRRLLRELPNVHAEWPATATLLEQDAQGVTVEVQHEGQASRRVRGKWLIACDGGSSPIRKQLKVQMVDLDFDEPWIVIDAMVNPEIVESLPKVMVQYCEPTRPATYIIGPGNHRRWEIMMLPGDSFSEGPPESELWPLLERWLKPGDAVLRRAATYRFHGLVASGWKIGRILLAGDSAHMTPPFLGQGMVQGLRDAQNLVWKLERVVKNSSAPTLLDTYEAERRPHVESTTRVAIDMGKVICEIDPVKAAARDQRTIDEQGGEVRVIHRQSLIPALRHGLIDRNSAGAGELMPQPRVCSTQKDTPLLDDLTGREWRVVAAADVSDQEIARIEEQNLAFDYVFIRLCTEKTVSNITPAICVVEQDAVISPWLQLHGARFLIARPDNYIYGTASDVDSLLKMLIHVETALDANSLNLS